MRACTRSARSRPLATAPSPESCVSVEERDGTRLKARAREDEEQGGRGGDISSSSEEEEEEAETASRPLRRKRRKGSPRAPRLPQQPSASGAGATGFTAVCEDLALGPLRGFTPAYVMD